MTFRQLSNASSLLMKNDFLFAKFTGLASSKFKFIENKGFQGISGKTRVYFNWRQKNIDTCVFAKPFA